MRRFVIIEKYVPWLWDKDEILYHDKDFMVLKIQSAPESALEKFYGFILFDKHFLDNYTQTQINDVARLSCLHYHNGLPICKNKRIFAPYNPTGIKSCEEYVVLLQNKRNDIIISVEKHVANKYELMMEKVKNYTKDIKDSGKEL